jgi:hypothetical protein
MDRLLTKSGDSEQASNVNLLHFNAFGFVVLRQFFEHQCLAAEIDQVMADGVYISPDCLAEGVAKFQYIPMMTAKTPNSLLLLDRAESVAETLLGCAVIPTRAKGVLYSGNTSWHIDSTLPLASIGVAAYLEPLDADTGALRVIPGSHLPEFAEAIRAIGNAELSSQAYPACVLATEPGDVIFFNEHLFHSSIGGNTRRQWRADYVSIPRDQETEHNVKSYFASIYTPDWDGGYNVDRYPNYGRDWLTSGRPCVSHLEKLGIYELASKQEAFMRSVRRI